MKHIIPAIGILAGLVLSSSVAAAGITVQPSSLTLEGSGPELAETITVGNPTSAVSIIEVYPDTFAEQISVEPSSFVLESGQERKVTVTATTEKNAVMTTSLSVVSKPLAEAEQNFGAATGAKIPLEIRAGGESSSSLAAIGGIDVSTNAVIAVLAGIVGVLLLVAFIQKRRRA